MTAAMCEVPASLARTVLEVHGERGALWLRRFGDHLANVSNRWGIVPGEPFANLSYNLVLKARRLDGARCVLKLGVPCLELSREIEALRLYEGRGAVRLLESDGEVGALLLERIEPGTQLSGTPDEKATEIAADVLNRIRRPLPKEGRFTPLSDLATGFERLRTMFGDKTGPLPERLVERAEALLRQPTAGADRVLLHGDLHHGNLLLAPGSSYVAIDPKGQAGPVGYDCGPFLRNRLPWSDPALDVQQVLDRRVAVFAEHLGLDEREVAAWGAAHATLSAWWSIEDHGAGWEEALACAELLDRHHRRM